MSGFLLLTALITTGGWHASSTALGKLHLLEEILASRNDNDPRLDTELKSLPEEAKELFRAKYRALPTDRFNERGTIVFLIGRAASNAEDKAFLRAVASEPAPSAPVDEHGLDVTFSYPQRMARRFLTR